MILAGIAPSEFFFGFGSFLKRHSLDFWIVSTSYSYPYVSAPVMMRLINLGSSGKFLRRVFLSSSIDTLHTQNINPNVLRRPIRDVCYFADTNTTIFKYYFLFNFFDAIKLTPRSIVLLEHLQ